MNEHLSWIYHINTLENKLSKHLGLRSTVQSKTIFKYQGNEKSLLLPFP